MEKTITIAPTINICGEADADKVVDKIVKQLEKEISNTKGTCDMYGMPKNEVIVGIESFDIHQDTKKGKMTLELCFIDPKQDCNSYAIFLEKFKRFLEKEGYATLNNELLPKKQKATLLACEEIQANNGVTYDDKQQDKNKVTATLHLDLSSTIAKFDEATKKAEELHSILKEISKFAGVHPTN